MTHEQNKLQNEGPPAATPAESETGELTKPQSDMAESMEHLLRFQRQTLILKNTKTIEGAFDSMEALLIEVIDFAFFSLLERNIVGEFTALREIRPDALSLDTSLMQWVMEKQEVAVIPVSLSTSDTELRSIIFLPFGPFHLMLLWLKQEASDFNREQEAFLSVLSREMAAVLETHRYHSHIEKTRAAMADIIESVPLGLLALDHEDHVLMINRTAEIALDVRRKEAVGNDYRETLSGSAIQLLSRMIPDNSPDEEELTVTSSNGDDQYLGVTVSPMRGADGSNRIGKVVVFRDLQLSREVQKLRRLDAMKNDFLSLVSHELRTPLTSILAYSETLLMDDNDNVPKDWREYLDIIHSEGKRLFRLIEDVLDLTKMEDGKMNYDFELCDPNEIVGAAVVTLMPMAESKSQTIELDLGEEIGDCNLAQDRFTQVVHNIVSNAIKYTDNGGRIIVRTSKHAPLPGASEPTFLLEVEDNGIGIAPENIDKVFSKFEMVEAIKHHTAGSGLGMTICKQIVEEGHQGKIWLESEPGVGTKVFVRIPISTK